MGEKQAIDYCPKLLNNEKSQLPVISRRIGNTTFFVSTRYSEKATETVTDKIKRLIRNDVKKI